MEVLGYMGAVAMGIVLGLMGGGGSILTIPILVYLFGLDMVTATMYSLCIVGLVGLVGGVRSLRQGDVDLPTLWAFGIPGVAGVLVTRRWIVPAIPDPLLTVGGVEMGRSLALLLLFAVLMLGASYGMIRKRNTPMLAASRSTWTLVMLGALIGVLTGTLGAGGGFLIIPALVLFAGLPMRKAVGTSLMIIAMNALIGFAGDLLHHPALDVRFLVVFCLLAIAGVLIGGRLSDLVPNEKLKPAFGWFVLVMGMYIIGRELSGMF